MPFSTSISRFTDYLNRHGFRATILRFGLQTKRGLFSSRMALFYCDLSQVSLHKSELPCSLRVERTINQANLSSRDLEQIASVWNRKLTLRNLQQRFGMGASLWLIKFEGSLAGYGWTLQGRTVKPHYFELGEQDVHFFDFHVFSQYRGQGLNPLFLKQILHDLASVARGRAFIEAAEWNIAQLTSLRKTSFQLLGLARKCTILGQTVVFWTGRQSAEQKRAATTTIRGEAPRMPDLQR